MTGNTSAAEMPLFVTHRFNQKQIQKLINELRTPMMLFFLQLSHSIADTADSDNSQLQSSPEIRML